MSETLTRFIKRMKNIDINILCTMNFPWVYIDSINGIDVTEKYQSKYYFTLGFMGLKENSFKFANMDVIFNLIRKYTKENI